MTKDSEENVEPGDRDPSKSALNLLHRIANDKGKLEVTLEKTEDSPLSRLTKSETGLESVTPTATNLAFFVWLDNRTSYNVDVDVRWTQLGSGAVQQTGGTVWSGQPAPFGLGGPAGCDTVYAYIMVVYIQGQYVGDTGVQQRQPGVPPCAHAYALGS